MTACVIIAGLAPILWSHGTGADVMKRIATPMVGGVITSTVMELLVYPAIYYLWRSQRLKHQPGGASPELPPHAGPLQPEPTH
jgi:Cu(I)/Ag(I) efflux system membrane protein CusA/SilA